MLAFSKPEISMFMLQKVKNQSQLHFELRKKSRHQITHFTSIDSAEKYVFNGIFPVYEMDGINIKHEYAIMLTNIILLKVESEIIKKSFRPGPHAIVYHSKYRKFISELQCHNALTNTINHFKFYMSDNMPENYILMMYNNDEAINNISDDAIYWIDNAEHKGIIMQPNIEDYGFMIRIGE